MADELVRVTDVVREKMDWVKWHLDTYLSSGGTKGHILDQTDVGGYNFSTTLILKTIGRKSAQVRMTPLIYGQYAGEVVVVASKGGADVHPAWYLNMEAHKDVEFQIGTQAFHASWRSPKGKENESDVLVLGFRRGPSFRERVVQRRPRVCIL